MYGNIIKCVNATTTPYSYICTFLNFNNYVAVWYALKAIRLGRLDDREILQIGKKHMNEKLVIKEKQKVK